ncbi:hydroxyacylglutathione hydrolase [Legionella micdadei]|uniref:Hydroxyacylglutathione hydrolase n=1 Tax=Legionella micdadei TaxID=451 RepID=A0A098GFB5_LEGMI|nr:hydroxyacylglutathione hydrolase [Legionella micdadei]ARG97730.1 hydroxyacylglutathione hydrolase [Legionella micdadei]ARG99957.1 hydroxyacylglutathione hydrolase [Legionella micdadei]KTD28432.1 hydroxyacylglutathione hydrolase (glyoxalase II) [Legionella micdadei]NSL18796.1 hydroxyacylglutathione hydrolase [Legionella micdadei]CEG60680.1 putative hydroxyacylglutathione hydrolase [Legionella micdadei]
MKVIPLPAFTDNYIWTILDENKQQAICVDPGDAKPVLDFLKQKNLTLKAILLTHHHYDHIGGTSDLLKRNPGIAVYGPEDLRILHVTHILQDGDILEIDSCRFTVLATPGHTSTHVCLYEPNHQWLFCGDTLFSAGCGRVFDGTLETLHDSLQKLKTLPDDTLVYCAHEYTLQNLRFAVTIEPDNMAIHNHLKKLLNQGTPLSLPSSIAIEKQINPFLRTHVTAVKEHAKLRGCQEDDSLSVFKQIRAEKDKF